MLLEGEKTNCAFGDWMSVKLQIYYIFCKFMLKEKLRILVISGNNICKELNNKGTISHPEILDSLTMR